MRQRPFGSCDLDSKASSTFSKVAGSRGGAPAAEAHFWSGLQFEEQQEGAFLKSPLFIKIMKWIKQKTVYVRSKDRYLVP